MYMAVAVLRVSEITACFVHGMADREVKADINEYRNHGTGVDMSTVTSSNG